MWQEMWDQDNAEWSPWILFDDQYTDGGVTGDGPGSYPGADIPEWQLAEWQLPPTQDEVDRILAEQDDFKMPDAFSGDYNGYQDWNAAQDWEPYQDYYVESLSHCVVCQLWKLQRTLTFQVTYTF